jgi:cell wall-associated NlpC family hydrolase
LIQGTRAVRLIIAITLSVVVPAPAIAASQVASSAAPAAPRGRPRSTTITAATTITARTYVITRQANPDRTIVRDSTGAWVATFTDDARTVNVAGPPRTFSDSTTTATVTTRTWVRLLAAPFAGTVDRAWLTDARTDRSPDVLALLMQYLSGAPPVYGTDGLQIAGDASFGPLQADGTRLEGSDFNDYLGIAWTYETGTTDQPEADQLRSLDCSGFVRTVFGYRSGLGMSLSPDGRNLPRRAVDMAASAPGTMTIPDSGAPTVADGRLQPGDLVFFDASTNDGTAIDHVGVYLGLDSTGHDRFVSSRKSADGPTLGDTNGKSILDGTGLYATTFRAARRL